MKRIIIIENNYEDGLKLEPRIFKRTDMIWRKNSCSDLNAKNDDEKHHHESFRHSGRIKSEEIEPTMKRVRKILEKGI